MHRRIPHIAVALLYVSSCSDKSGGAGQDEPATDTEATTSSTSGVETGTDTSAVDPEFEGMVFVEAGEFGRGCNSALDTWGCRDVELPAAFVTLDAFWIDETEVSRGAYQDCVAAGGCTPLEAQCVSGAPAWVAQAQPDLPAVCVSHSQARDYCAWDGKRLPTEAEWEKAARGSEGQAYPWGNGAPVCLQTQISECGDAPVAVGSLENGASPYGALEMAGNVAEWTADRFGPREYAEGSDANPTGNKFLPNRVARGGSHLLGRGEPGLTTWFREELPPEGHAHVGFRCVRSPEPGTCGNGVLEVGEVCDDGNDVAGDGCESDCEASGTVRWMAETVTPMELIVPTGESFALVSSTVVQWLPPGEEEFRTSNLIGCCDVAVASPPGALALAFGRFEPPATSVAESVVVREYAAEFANSPADPTVLWEWERPIDQPSGLLGVELAALGDGRLVLSYHTTDAERLLMLDPSAPSGSEVVWELPYSRATAMATARDDAVVIAGRDGGVPFVSWFDPDGNELWRRNANFGANNGAAPDVAVDGDGNVFVAVNLREPPIAEPLTDGPGEFGLAKYDSEGRVIASNRFEIPLEHYGNQLYEWVVFVKLAVSPQGVPFVAGNWTTREIVVVKLTPEVDGVSWLSKPLYYPGQINSMAFNAQGDLLWIGPAEAGGYGQLGALERL